jgi:hypothetical protein
MRNSFRCLNEAAWLNGSYVIRRHVSTESSHTWIFLNLWSAVIALIRKLIMRIRMHGIDLRERVYDMFHSSI